MDTLHDMADQADAADYAEGLRERKKRLTRQLLSDTATMLFLERGFDGFKITEVAEACDVSEKTVYNYFPTKESLILDQEEAVAAAIRHALGPEGAAMSPVEAMLDVLALQRRHMREGLAEVGGEEAGLAMFRRFMAAVDETPSLRAANGEMMDRLARVAATALAERAGVSPDDPEPTIAGQALMGLALVQNRALRRDDPADESVADVYARADAELRRAARLVDTGLWSFSLMASGGGSREQLKAAADATHAAGRQVAAALRHARKLWAEMQPSAPPGEPGVGVPGSPAGSGDWPFSGEFPFSGQGATSRDPASRQQWREVQREQVQRWRESQRAQTEELKASAKAFQQESRESARRMKENLKAAHRVHQEELRNARHADKEPPH